MKISLKLFSLLVVYLLASSCNDDEDVSSPPASTIQVNATSGLVGDTEFTFTISSADASAITILPKGQENTGKAGILVSKAQFSGGSTATVKYKYDEPGVFSPVVVTTNYSLDGKNVKQTVSAPVTVTITSNKNEISAFSIGDNKSETIDQGAGTILVKVPFDPYGKTGGLSAVKATFTAAAFSVVTVGGTVQKSGETPNDFSTPKVYTVTAQNGTTKTYTVTLQVAPVETTSEVKTFGAKSISKANDGKELSASVDNTTKKIVIYDTLGTPSNRFDSLRVNYELVGKFAVMNYGTAELEQDSLLNLTSSKSVTVKAQNASTATFAVHAVAAPKLSLSFGGLNPTVAGKNKNFNISLNVLTGTTVTNIATTSSTNSPAGVSVTGIKADGVAFTSGNSVDFSEPVEFELTVNDTNIGVTYKVIYTATVTVLP